jgi:hypothetical protein
LPKILIIKQSISIKFVMLKASLSLTIIN